MIKRNWIRIFLLISGIAWANETDDEIIKYLDFYENLEILTDQNIPDVNELDLLDPNEKGDT